MQIRNMKLELKRKIEILLAIKINFIVLFFLLGCLTLGVVGWHLLKSRVASSLLAEKISEEINKKIATRISFKKVELSLFPFGILLKDIHVESNDFRGSLQETTRGIHNKTLWIRADVERLLIRVRPLDMLLKKITIKDLEFKNGIIRANFPDLASEVFSKGKKSEEEATEEKREKIDEKKIILEILSAISILKKNLTTEIDFGGKNKWKISVESISLHHFENFLVDNEININEFHVDFKNGHVNTELILGYSKIKHGSLTWFRNDDYMAINSAEIRAKIAEDKIEVTSFKINHSELEFALIGVSNWAKGNIESGGGTRAVWTLKGQLGYLASWPTIRDMLKVKSGAIDISGDIKGSIFDPSIIVKGKIDNVDCKFFQGDEITFKVKKNEGAITLVALEAKKNNGHIKLINPANIYDIKNKKLTENVLKISLDRMHTNNLFYFINDVLGALKGEISGEIELQVKTVLPKFYSKYKKDDPEFKQARTVISVRPLSELKIEKFSLLGKNDRPVLINNGFILSKGWIEIYIDKFLLELQLSLGMKKSNIVARGYVDSKGIQIDIDDQSIVDLQEVGPIVGQEMEGVGKAGLHVHGPFKEVIFDFDIDFEKGKVLGFNLGKIKTKVAYNLEQGVLTIKDGQGKQGETLFSIAGILDFKKSKIDLKGGISQGDYAGTLHLLRPITQVLTFLPKKILGFYRSRLTIGGSISLQGLDVAGDFIAKELVVDDEKIDEIKANFYFKDMTAVLDRIMVEKNSAVLKGFFQRNIKLGIGKYNFDINNLEIASIEHYKRLGLSLNGQINGNWKGNVNNFKDKSEINLKLTGSSILGNKVKESSFYLSRNDKQYDAVVDLMGGVVNADFKWNSKEEYRFVKNVEANIKVYSENIAQLIAMFFSHNIESKLIKGGLIVDLSSRFNAQNIRNLDLEMKVDEFYFLRGAIKTSIQKEHKHILIKDSKIKKWDLIVDGEGAFIRSEGEGDLLTNYKIKNFINTEMSLLEVFFSKISSGIGNLENKIVLSGKGGNSTIDLLSQANDVGFKYEGLQSSLSGIKYKLFTDHDNLIVELLKGKFAGGDFNISGKILKKEGIPAMDLNYTINDVEWPLAEKSSFLVSGSGALMGNAPPYVLNGDLAIRKGKISDEFSNFAKKNNNDFIKNRFIPQSEVSSSSRKIMLNLNATVQDILKVRNSMTEISFVGRGQVKGFLEEPKLVGNFQMVPGSGKFFFKSNDFTVTKGVVNFSEDDIRMNPELNFEAIAHISDYNVMLSIAGKTKNLNVDLSSSPPLSKPDILSLLALGFPGDISQGLSEEEKQSLTSIGIGGILFERFHLNENLDSLLGVRLSLSSEYSEEDGSAGLKKGASPATSSSSSYGYKYKTATKVKAQKRMTNRINLSVASTVGGTGEQKQEMNLSYDISKKISVEGVYEVKTGSEEEGENDSSGGVDLKLRWTYK
ncbi:MAG: translocation/assembly module TamB domain-containing protein [Oligoflexia bacterium]|nr:translocation/assembly module TamB domain-containing protein [Oligoflexia bacterium]